MSHCGGVQPLLDHMQHKHVMSFLMGLNEVFNHIRGQILLQDLLPQIDHVFSLVNQDEKQRKAGVSHPISDATMVYAINHIANPKGKGFKKDCPMCTHCGMTGHTKEKCFKFWIQETTRGSIQCTRCILQLQSQFSF